MRDKRVGRDLVTKQQQYVCVYLYTHTHTHIHTYTHTHTHTQKEKGEGHTSEPKHYQYAWQNIKDCLKGILTCQLTSQKHYWTNKTII